MKSSEGKRNGKEKVNRYLADFLKNNTTEIAVIRVKRCQRLVS